MVLNHLPWYVGKARWIPCKQIRIFPNEGENALSYLSVTGPNGDGAASPLRSGTFLVRSWSSVRRIFHEGDGSELLESCEPWEPPPQLPDISAPHGRQCPEIGPDGDDSPFGWDLHGIILIMRCGHEYGQSRSLENVIVWQKNLCHVEGDVIRAKVVRGPEDH